MSTIMAQPTNHQGSVADVLATARQIFHQLSRVSQRTDWCGMHQITKKMNTEQHGLLPGFDTSDGSRQTICSSLQLMTMLFLWWWWFSIGGDFSVVVVRLDGWLPKTYSMAKSNDPWEDTSEWMMMTIMVYQDADDDDGDGCDNDDGSLMERQKSINCSMRRRSWVITVRNQHGNDDHDQDDRMQLWGWWLLWRQWSWWI